MRAIYLIVVTFTALWCAEGLHAQEVIGCGSLSNTYGPFDYRDPIARHDRLPIVERFHFTQNVQMLVGGESGTLIGDLDYTLRAFPNYYPALETVKRYALAGGKPLAGRPIECYFKRAIAFRADDPGVRVIYGNYLMDCARLAKNLAREKLQCAGLADPEFRDARILSTAKNEYDTALRLAPASPEINYDAALFYLDINDVSTARRLAAVAYQGGYPLMGLKKKLAEAEPQQGEDRHHVNSP